jgi:hypothetical protein
MNLAEFSAYKAQLTESGSGDETAEMAEQLSSHRFDVRATSL